MEDRMIESLSRFQINFNLNENCMLWLTKQNWEIDEVRRCRVRRCGDSNANQPM